MKFKRPLTKRETEIAECLAWGASKKEVANRLYISPRTVENTARNIYEKIKVRSIGQLCAWWFCTKFKISVMLNPLLRNVQRVVSWRKRHHHEAADHE